MDERLNPLNVKIWSVAIQEEYSRTSLLQKMLQKHEPVPLSRWQMFKNRIWWRSYRTRAYLRNLWRALLGREEWE